jgi:hypothetical protein
MGSWICNPDSGCIHEVFVTLFIFGDNTDVVETGAIKVLGAQI